MNNGGAGGALLAERQRGSSITAILFTSDICEERHRSDPTGRGRPGADQSQSDVRIAHKATYGGLRRRKIRWIALAASPAYGLSGAEESRSYRALEASAHREAN
jgi:hypothetical protein